MRAAQPAHDITLPLSFSTTMSAAQPPAKMPPTKSPSPPVVEAPSSSPSAGPAPSSAAQQFTEETWARIMSHCSVFDLFCLRDACRLFRTMIDQEVLQDALSDAGLRHLCDITDEAKVYLPVALGDPTTFMKMLCVGPCSVGLQSPLRCPQVSLSASRSVAFGRRNRPPRAT